MSEEPTFDFRRWIPGTAAGTGDSRENDPGAAGFTEEDTLFRSHFQHANRLADRAFEHVRPAYQIGRAAGSDPSTASHEFETIEKDLENGWLSVRTSGSDWGSVREFARAGFDSARQGRITDAPSSGTSEEHQRPPYSDPLPENVDSTEPGGPTG